MSGNAGKNLPPAPPDPARKIPTCPSSKVPSGAKYDKCTITLGSHPSSTA